MANYIRQPNFNSPTRGQDTIEHFVQCFAADTPAILQTNINAFLASLIPLPETPQIISIEFNTTRSGVNEDYSALVHYVLIS